MNIIIERGKVWNFEDLPEYSIALDGFCSGPRIDTEHHRYSFDHHGNCLRFCTLATCAQAYNAIRLGLDPYPYKIYLNDIDIDTATAVWVLSNPDKINDTATKKLIEAVNLGDMYLGAVPLNGMWKAVEWISSPETDAKRNGDYEILSNDMLRSLLEAVLHRITMFVDGEAQAEINQMSKQTDFKILRNENGYVVAESQDPHAFAQLYQAGFDRVVLTRKLTDGSLAVSFAKKSNFIDGFPLDKIYEEINKVEPGAGGSDTCGGVVRNQDGSRSHLSLEQITEIVDRVILDNAI